MRLSALVTKRLIFFWLVLFILFGVFLKLASDWKHYKSLSDVMWLTFFLFEDSTMYSEKYSEEVFRRITRNLDKREVLQRLGDPLIKEACTQEHNEIWRYTSALDNKNYWFRIIVFDSHGKVLKIERKYYVD